MISTEERCLCCDRPADGTLRAAYWEEEERGRLAAKSAALCPACHADFLAGRLSRVRVAEAVHARRGYHPAEWIQRIDRDTLLDVACLQCGALLAEEAAAGEFVACGRCGGENLFGERRTAVGTQTGTVSLRRPFRTDLEHA